MRTPKKDNRATRAFAIPMIVILVLLAIHWVVSDWPAVPRLISSTLASIQ